MQAAAPTLPILAEARRTGPGVALQIDHAHQELEFNLVVSGKGTYFLESGQHDLVPGTLVWLLPHQSHRLIRSPDLDLWVVTIAPGDLDQELLEDVARQPCRVLSTADAVALDRQLSQLSQDADEPRLYQAGLNYALRSAWHLAVTNAGPPRKPMHPAVLQAISILRSNADTPTSARLAKMCGITQDYLGQLLMEHTGRGFVEWRNRTRLERFLIVYPNSRDLLNAALDAGFGSYTQFHRVFCELVGTTPGEWAKSGDQTKSLALLSETSTISGSSAESDRMVWYTLIDAVFPNVAESFGPAFAAHFLRSPVGNAPRVQSGITSYKDLCGLEAQLLDSLLASAPALADKLARIFYHQDLIEYYKCIVAHYGFDPSDLASFVTGYLMMAYMSATQTALPSFETVCHVDARVRTALALSGTLIKADERQRKLIAAALLAMTCFLRAALVGARGSGCDAVVIRASNAAHAAVLKMFCVDLRAVELEHPAPALQALAS